MELLCIIIETVSFYGKGENMSIQIELLRNKLEKLVAVTESLVDNDVVSLSQELDKLIFQYYSCKLE